MVVDDDDAVDLALDEEVGERLRDGDGVRVDGPVGEVDPGLLDRVAAEAERRAPLLADDDPADLGASGPHLRSSWSAANDLRVEGAGEAAVAGQRQDRHGLDRLAPRGAGSRGRGVARAVPIISSRIRSAYGRSAAMRVVRRSFAAATPSRLRDLARVADGAGRRLMSWTVAIRLAGAPARPPPRARRSSCGTPRSGSGPRPASSGKSPLSRMPA